MPQIINEPTINPGVTLNMDRSTSKTWVSFAGLGFIKLIATMIITMAKKVMVIRSKNG